MLNRATSTPETEDAKRARLAREAEQIGEALADAASGRTVSHDAVKTWVDSWDTSNELPRPQPAI